LNVSLDSTVASDFPAIIGALLPILTKRSSRESQDKLHFHFHFWCCKYGFSGFFARSVEAFKKKALDTNMLELNHFDTVWLFVLTKLICGFAFNISF